jgi:hypothetical protein
VKLKLQTEDGSETGLSGVQVTPAAPQPDYWLPSFFDTAVFTQKFISSKTFSNERFAVMPTSVPSHQAAVLPLKIKWPDKFDGTSLCVGSLAPDIPWFLSLFYAGATERTFHSIGEIVYVLPLSLVLVVLFDKVLLPAASFLASNNRLGKISRCLAFFGVDEWYILKKKKINTGWLVKASYSIILGILSHFLLDLPTHYQITYLLPFYEAEMPSWFLQECGRLGLPFYGVVGMTNYDLLWLLFTVVFGVLALYQLRYIKKHKLMAKWHESELRG